MLLYVIHDAIIARTSTNTDRRDSERVDLDAELVVRWFDDPRPVRFAVRERSDGGYRSRASIPMLPGTMGTALRMLPVGEHLEHAVMVAWSREVDGCWEIGLRRI